MSSIFFIIFILMRNPVIFVAYMAHLIYIYYARTIFGVGCRLYSLQIMMNP